MGDFDVFAVAGPTAVGKSQVALKIALEASAEVVSADAFQVYCYMDIGTAKVPINERIFPLHHMIDVCLPDEEYSVARYQREARACIEGILKRGKKAVVCGGTPLYLTALLFDIEIPPEKKIPGLRDELVKEAKKSPESVVARLKEIDPEALIYINPNNLRRVIRAIELFEQAGVRYSELYRRWTNRKPYYKKSLIIWLYREREEIYSAIEERVSKMFKSGLIEEAISLRRRFKFSSTAIQAIGYREVFDYLDGKISLEESIELIRQRTRNYAKRQMSWFRNDARFEPVDISGCTGEEAAEKILNRFFSKDLM
jgi:tRNA dimethylallyltransferase